MQLTDSQKAQRDKLFAIFDESRKDIMRRMESGPADQIDARNAELGKALLDLQDKLLALLTSQQASRLLEIAIQQEGSVALTDDLVARKLALTAAERSKIHNLLAGVEKAQDDYQAALGDALAKYPDASQSKKAEIVQSMKPQEKKFEEYKTSQTRQIYLLLTPAQRTKWDQMHGKKLKSG